jgi:hypothetical protein
MGGTCRVHESDEKRTIFWPENLKGIYYFRVLGVDGRIILKVILGK